MELKYKKLFYYLLAIFILMLFCQCEKQDERIEMNLIANIWSGCNPPMYNTAILKLNDKEYIFNLEREGMAYVSTNSILIYKGEYAVELINIDGVMAHPEQNGLNGAVVVPKAYSTTYFQDDYIRTQVFCR